MEDLMIFDCTFQDGWNLSRKWAVCCLTVSGILALSFVTAGPISPESAETFLSAVKLQNLVEAGEERQSGKN